MKQTQTIAFDMSVLMQSDVPYEERVALCKRLGLVHTLKHDGHDYVKITPDGYAVVAAIMRMVVDAHMHPDDKIVQQ
jgi:hypothetical protein